MPEALRHSIQKVMDRKSSFSISYILGDDKPRLPESTPTIQQPSSTMTQSSHLSNVQSLIHHPTDILSSASPVFGLRSLRSSQLVGYPTSSSMFTMPSYLPTQQAPVLPFLSSSEIYHPYLDPLYREYASRSYTWDSIFSRIPFHKRKGGQVRFSNDQTVELEKKFDSERYLSPGERKKIAKKLHLSERQVKTWFQNRRAKWRRLKQEKQSRNASNSGKTIGNSTTVYRVEDDCHSVVSDSSEEQTLCSASMINDDTFTDLDVESV